MSAGYRDDIAKSLFEKGQSDVLKYSDSQARRPKGPGGGQFAPKGGGGGGAGESKPKGGWDHAGAQGELDRAKYGDHAPPPDTGHTIEGAWRGHETEHAVEGGWEGPGPMTSGIVHPAAATDENPDKSMFAMYEHATGNGGAEGVKSVKPTSPAAKQYKQQLLDALGASSPKATPKGLAGVSDVPNQIGGAPSYGQVKSKIKALRQQITERNASKYDRMNQHGADPGMITSSINRANKKDRDAIKRLQSKLK